MLEMFTGRRPTDEMFKDGFNLHNFVKMAIPERTMQIVDPAILAAIEEKAPAAKVKEANYINGETEAGEENINYVNISEMNPFVRKCILPVLEIGLACLEKSPKRRVQMQDVTGELHRIQNALIGVEIRRERPKISS